ncbi:MAG: dTDP-4-dehydrorhamnose reductase [Inhella sp.]
MRIVLLGAKGQVGWELQRALAPLGELLAWDRERADLSNPEALVAQLRAVAPQALVNAAAYTAVDKAESEPELAQRVNAEAPTRLAVLAAELGIPLVHYSTDYVFDGSGNQARDESAATGPLSVYGATKLAGEEGIRASGCAHLILRTSWVYAARGGNFAKTMLRLAAEREQLRVVNDQIGAPTGAELLADGAAHALRSLLAQPDLSGTYHLCASGETNWADYARFVIDQARAKGQVLRCQEVQGIPSADYPTPARRPLNSRLDCRRFETTFGLRLPHWEQGVRRMLDEVIG